MTTEFEFGDDGMNAAIRRAAQRGTATSEASTLPPGHEAMNRILRSEAPEAPEAPAEAVEPEGEPSAAAAAGDGDGEDRPLPFTGSYDVGARAPLPKPPPGMSERIRRAASWARGGWDDPAA